MQFEAHKRNIMSTLEKQNRNKNKKNKVKKKYKLEKGSRRFNYSK